MEKRLQNEIEHGRFLAQHDPCQTWNWDGAAGRRRWFRRVEMLMADLRPNMEVLELGCGSGFFTRELVKSCSCVNAIDISPDLLDLAKLSLPNSNVTFKVENAYEMSFDDNSFDAVVGISVLHHLDIDKGLSEIFRVLKPGGFIIFTEPNMMNPQIALQKNIPALKKLLGDSPDETAFFRWGIRSRLYNFGFRNTQVFPFDFLHPSLPARFVPLLEQLCMSLENIPVIREIAGSIYIRANKES
jgi:2-polyprenyl-3-methyl-5-hydroxy-6-metoxy-1,4-benzoquinol methylase